MRRAVRALCSRLGQAIGAWALIASLAGHAVAQPCVGDCSGEGRVTIADLILAVNIALGQASLEQCPALGQAPIGVDRLILAVNNALCGCGSCPAPLPTRTFTVTPTPTATVATPTPSRTPTPTPIVSTWHEDSGKITSSTCPSDVTTQLRQELATATDDFTVRQSGDQVEIRDTEGNTETSTIDADGTVHIAETIVESEGGNCVATFGEQFTVNLSSSPTAATYGLTVSSVGCPRNLKCKVQFTTRWTRTSAAQLQGRSVRAVMRAAVHATL